MDCKSLWLVTSPGEWRILMLSLCDAPTAYPLQLITQRVMFLSIRRVGLLTFLPSFSLITVPYVASSVVSLCFRYRVALPLLLFTFSALFRVCRFFIVIKYIHVRRSRNFANETTTIPVCAHGIISPPLLMP
jgi:hypothetical protein